MTFGSLFKEPETIQYPVQTRFVPEGLKGHIANDIDACILCGICQKRCPTDAIVVDKPGLTWSIDRFRCIQCGSCVRECPEKCLTMETTYAAAAAKKSIVVINKPEDLEAKAAKEAEKAARVKAAMEAKAAREAKAAQENEGS